VCFGILCPRTGEETVDLPAAVFEAMHQGDAAQVRSLITTAYLAGASVASLCDGPLRQAMQRLGELWRHGQDGIAIEHHATSICIQVMEQLRQFQADPRADAPVAIGGGCAEDPYLVPSQMAGVVLAECGYRAINLGPHTPNIVLLAAVAKHKPVLVWRSLTGVMALDKTEQELRELAEKLGDIPLVIGGRHAAQIPTGSMPGVQMVGSMCELAAFARALVLRRPH
jgi:methanogenic corrinoid protein MtbC1